MQNASFFGVVDVEIDSRPRGLPSVVLIPPIANEEQTRSCGFFSRGPALLRAPCPLLQLNKETVARTTADRERTPRLGGTMLCVISFVSAAPLVSR